MTPTELASLEALAKAATPGEWTNNWTGNETDEMDCVSSVAVGMIADCSQPVLYSEEVTVNPKANAAYIAAANPAAILSLIEEYNRMREALERVRSTLATADESGLLRDVIWMVGSPNETLFDFLAALTPATGA